MCYQAAGPKGSDIRGDGHLPIDVTCRVIDEASRLPELAGDRVHVSGGESFLNYEEMLAIFRQAKSNSFGNIGATTNAFWAVNDTIADRKCMELADAGATYFEVSIDYWHLPYVSIDRVRCLLRAMRRTGLRATLRTLTSRSHHMDELLADFADAELLQVIVGNGRVQPVGRGASTVPPSEVYYSNGPEGCCEQQLNLTITPNGNVYPCCAGADMTESLSSGNVHRDTLAEAVIKMRTDQMIREVIHGGTGQLIPIIQELGFGDRLLPQYSGICHLCWDVFKDNEMADALREHFQERQFQALVGLVSGAMAGQTVPVEALHAAG
jgi:MoaA/NifB/PqqE/SkfB family radical SAM enzyme